MHKFQLQNVQQTVSNPLSPAQDAILRSIQNDLDRTSENLEDECENLPNISDSCSKLNKLKELRIKSEHQYYQTKAIYFSKMNENSKIKKTVMILQARKIQLEIEKMRKEH